MEIIQRGSKYFLQFDAGELEISEQQVKQRVERGDVVLNHLNTIKEKQPKIEARPPAFSYEEDTNPESNDWDLSEEPTNVSAKYFDYVLTEFEAIYKANQDDPNTLEKLIKFCINAISKLESDRKNPHTDHVLIDYYLLSWNRVIDFVKALPEQVKTKDNEVVTKDTEAPNHASPVVSEPIQEQPPKPEDYTKQLMIIQLMQADGLFPINNAIEGVTQKDIVALIGGIINADSTTTFQAMHQASAILLKRNITAENVAERIRLLEELDAYFEQMPYANIISRIKLLLKIYRNY